jgi:predicted membrane GTPase involved in stress response
MSQRDMVHSPIPVLDSKYAPIVTKLDAILAKTFQSIRQLHSVIKSRCKGEEIAAEALVSLLRASWAVENSQDSGRQIVANHDKQTYKTFIHTMKSITSQVESITKKCIQHNTIPFNLTAEALLFGGDIIVLTRNYTK